MAWTEKYVSVAGAGAHDGTSEANAWTLAEAIAAVAAGNRVNVKAGTYANTTTARTFATAGTTTAPIWWRGYKTTIADMDTQPTSTRVDATDIPLFTWTTSWAQFSGAHQRISNISFLGASVSGGAVFLSAANIVMQRCRVENTAAHASGNALSIEDEAVVEHTWAKATSTATYACYIQNDCQLYGMSIVGGVNGIGLVATNRFILIEDSTITNSGTTGLLVTNAPWILTINGLSIYAPGTDGIKLSALPVISGVIRRSILANCGGWGINQASGANTNKIYRSSNDFYSNTSGTETGFGDSSDFYRQTESASPFTSAPSDLSLVTGAVAKAGAGGLFENLSYTNYIDIGAAQRQEPAGGGSNAYVIGG